MKEYPKRQLTLNIVSPYSMALFSYLIFLISWLFPPETYSAYIQEPDFLYLNWPSFFYYSLCVLSFMLGVRLIRSFVRGPRDISLPTASVSAPLLYLCVPLVLCTLYCIGFVVQLGAHIDYVSLLGSQQGQSIKSANGSGMMNEGSWNASLIVTSAVLLWAAYRFFQLKMKPGNRIVFYLVFSMTFFAALLVCIATVARGDLMPILSGLVIIYTFAKTRSANARIGRILLTVFGSGFGIIGAFSALAFLRGANGGKALVTSFLGYTIVSYNRMAAMVTGVMHYANEGHFIYVFPLMVNNNRLNSIIPLRDYFGWPDAIQQFKTEFISVVAAGLNSSYNWSGLFGYLYSDLGWWTPVYTLCLGIMAGIFWSRFCAGKTDGILWYLAIAFSILFWFSLNWLFREQVTRYFGAIIVLMIYDKLLLRPAKATRPQAVVQPYSIDPFAPRFRRGELS
jgi:hypothetical protein